MIGGGDFRGDLQALAERVAQTLPDVEIVKTTVTKDHGAWILRVVVDRDGGVSIDLCGEVSRRLADLIDGSGTELPDYRIEVESAGLERPLYTQEHYRRFAGKKAKVVTSQPLGNRVEFTGPIVAADAAAVVIDDPHAGATAVPYGIIKHARLVYDARPDLKKH